jgi:cytochrome c oxidase cbb3-type subunit III
MIKKLIFAGGILFGALGFLSCEREERGFRVETPDANRINSKQLTTLQPGVSSPTPVFKNEYENNAQALATGKQLFKQMNCYGCHANGGGAIGPPLMDSKWIYGGEPDQVFATIVEGRPNGMPAFHGKMPDYQVWQLVAYVRSMSGQASPNAAGSRDDDMKVGEPENSRQKEKKANMTIPKSAEAPQ